MFRWISYGAGVCSAVLMPVASVALSLHFNVNSFSIIGRPIGIGACLLAIAMFSALQQNNERKYSDKAKALISCSVTEFSVFI